MVWAAGDPGQKPHVLMFTTAMWTVLLCVAIWPTYLLTGARWRFWEEAGPSLPREVARGAAERDQTWPRVHTEEFSPLSVRAFTPLAGPELELLEPLCHLRGSDPEFRDSSHARGPLQSLELPLRSVSRGGLPQGEEGRLPLSTSQFGQPTPYCPAGTGATKMRIQ